SGEEEAAEAPPAADPSPAGEKFEDAFEAKPALVPGSPAPARAEAPAPAAPETATEEPVVPAKATPPALPTGASSPDPAPIPVIGDGRAPKESAASGPATPAPAKRKAGCWTIFATLFFIATVLVVALLAAAAVFAWTQVGKFE